MRVGAKLVFAFAGLAGRINGRTQGSPLPEPLVAVLRDELVVVQVRVRAVDAVDLLRLPGTHRLMRVEAPGAFQQSLSAQDLVDAGDAAVEVVGAVEERGVAVGDFYVEAQQLGRELALSRRGM